ncbi:MAG: hypothetical protein IT269_13485 [Saprospiraceae bacterium]|nr:hypothetical protein [Saprospiraceae bacterium]
MKNLTVLLTFTVLLLTYCVQPPDYPIEPVIELKNVSKNELKQGQGSQDSLFVTFTFTDGDGDLGDQDSLNIFVVDGRDGNEKSRFRIPFIEPQGTGNGINGEITVRLNTSCCIYVTPEGIPVACEQAANYIEKDTLTYRISIRDRAGHRSNEIETSQIVLKCK